MKTVSKPSIALKTRLDEKDYGLIAALAETCSQNDQTALKLELDYKLGVALSHAGKPDEEEVNEFLYFSGQHLVGYAGICAFGGAGAPLEITGMVHPEYRRRGIFTALHKRVVGECQKRNAGSALFLCDHKSMSGLNFLKRIGADYQYSEFEMYLTDALFAPGQEQMRGIALRKATNKDAREITRQNAIYFHDTAYSDSDLTMPEDEEKRGMTYYLAQKGEQIVGKVHLETNGAVSGIYGLGVLPEYRGAGLGRALLLSAVKTIKQSRTSAIMLQVAAENAAALNLYRSCGFKETSVMDYFCLTL